MFVYFFLEFFDFFCCGLELLFLFEFLFVELVEVLVVGLLFFFEGFLVSLEFGLFEF